MRRRLGVCGGALLLVSPALAAPVAAAPRWSVATAGVFSDAQPGTSVDVELADLNGDRRVDLLFANSRGEDLVPPGGADEPNQAFIWHEGQLVDVSDALLPGVDAARVILARDFDGDDRVDLFIGSGWQTRSQLLVQLPEADALTPWLPRFAPLLGATPSSPASVGAAAPGDVDGDGDLDLALVDWGPGPSHGGPDDDQGGARLWLNDDGVLLDETLFKLPLEPAPWSWAIELIDLDADLDLDLVVSARGQHGPALTLLRNDGLGNFDVASPPPPSALGQPIVGLVVAAFDGGRDPALDLLLLRQGAPHLALRGDDVGGLQGAPGLWSEPTTSEHAVASALDVDQDGFVDLLLWDGGDPPLRLYRGSETSLSLAPEPAAALQSVELAGARDLELADLDRDGRLDVVIARGGELPRANVVLLATEENAADARPPVIARVLGPDPETPLAPGDELVVRARVHDHKWPARAVDLEWTRLEWRWGAAGDEFTADDAVEMRWYGEHLYRGRVAIPTPAPAAQLWYRVCAADAALLEAPCSTPRAISLDMSEETSSATDGDSASASESDAGSDAGSSGDDSLSGGPDGDAGSASAGDASSTDSGTDGDADADDDGCNCAQRQGARAGSSALALLLALALTRRRRRRRA
ncbi:MAG: VCBS repeat-containing protein [Myxococcales bacterium]|nr:VCBS repeat-containing protein [Myxococcales bacterium]MCB9748614.1 VCBS repeat-containing protein [Myxococcales bacterium]